MVCPVSAKFRTFRAIGARTFSVFPVNGILSTARAFGPSRILSVCPVKLIPVAERIELGLGVDTQQAPGEGKDQGVEDRRGGREEVPGERVVQFPIRDRRGIPDLPRGGAAVVRRIRRRDHRGLVQVDRDHRGDGFDPDQVPGRRRCGAGSQERGHRRVVPVEFQGIRGALEGHGHVPGVRGRRRPPAPHPEDRSDAKRRERRLRPLVIRAARSRSIPRCHSGC